MYVHPKEIGTDRYEEGLDFSRVVAIVAVIHLVIYAAMFYASPESIKVQFQPDDAYYYKVLAKNFSEYGTWTFDGSPTSGFHLLHAYIMSFVGDIGIPLFIVGAAYFLWGQGMLGVLLAFAFLTTKNVVFNMVSGMEWPLVVVLSFAYLHKETKYLPLIGFLGSLARTEFLILPICLLVFMRNKEQLWGAVGAIAGTGAVALHSYVLTGELLQSSALIKAYWATLGATTYPTYMLLIPAGLGILLFVLKKRPDGFELGCLAALTVYILLYMNVAHSQRWYSAMLIAPMWCCAYGIMERIRFSWVVATVVILINLVRIYPQESPFPWQEQMYVAAKSVEGNAVIGSWNAGIFAWYRGNVVNLDGLVNNEIHPYIKRNEVRLYLQEKHIRYIMDFSHMINERKPIHRDKVFLASLHEVGSVGNIKLWRIE